jgi:DNA repair ATPase RecN
MTKYSEEFIQYTDGRINNLYRLIDKYNAKIKNTEHMMDPANINRKITNARKILVDLKVVQENIQQAIFKVEKYKNILDNNMKTIVSDDETLQAQSQTLQGLAYKTVKKYHIPATDPFAAQAIEHASANYKPKKGGKTKRKKRSKSA